ncbi:MAG: hypothetical protein NT031_03265, partial [Planctomycetota bacterium]|nr:hypothetical protein [Planctomycetota bacterium]
GECGREEGPGESVRTLSPCSQFEGSRPGNLYEISGMAPKRVTVVEVSSIVENRNSPPRSYFFLRREIGNDYPALPRTAAL